MALWKYAWRPAPVHAVKIAGSPERAKQLRAMLPRTGPGGGITVSRARLGIRDVDLRPELGVESTGKPCVTKRKTCPIQLIMKGGHPFLRLCKKSGNRKPGFLIPAGSPREALQRSREMCGCWKKAGKNFASCIARTVGGEAEG
jgi:hypothetical protein